MCWSVLGNIKYCDDSSVSIVKNVTISRKIVAASPPAAWRQKHHRNKFPRGKQWYQTGQLSAKNCIFRNELPKVESFVVQGPLPPFILYFYFNGGYEAYFLSQPLVYRVAIKEWPPRNVAAAKNWSFGSESINNKNCSLYL